jgi:glycosyltransferase involved in cell wall biosynthesis
VNHTGPQPERLTVFTSFSGQGGVERMVLNLVREFARRGINIDLLALKASSDHLRDLPETVNLIHLKARHSSTVVGELARYLRQAQPEAMLVAKDRPGRAAIKARRKAGVATRIVIRLGTNLSGAMAHRHGLRRWLREWPVKTGYRSVDRIVAVSQGVADDTARITGLPQHTFTVIRNPVITPTLHQLAAETISHRWMQQRDLPVILAAGRLTVQKDFATLIKAIHTVNQTQPVRLIILGEGNLRDELNQQIRQLALEEHIDLPGFTANPYPWMQQADLFVLSSRWEGSPNVLTEAIALGTPVVATDCPSGPRELLQDGRYGPLVPMGDTNALANAILNTLKSPLDKTTLQKAASEYTAENSASRYLATLFPSDER